MILSDEQMRRVAETLSHHHIIPDVKITRRFAHGLIMQGMQYLRDQAMIGMIEKCSLQSCRHKATRIIEFKSTIGISNIEFCERHAEDFLGVEGIETIGKKAFP